MATARNLAIAALIDPVVPTLPSAPQEISGDPSGYVNVAVANANVFGGQAVLTPQNVDTVQALTILQSSASRTGFSSNILESRSNMPSLTGNFVFTAIINAGKRQKTSRIGWTGSANFTAAKTKALAWAATLANTMGNAGVLVAGSVVTDTGVSAQSPYITYIRITDAVNPRLGNLVTTPPGNSTYAGEPGASVGLNSADFISTALSLRLQGVTNTGNVTYANHAFYGVPDLCVVNGDQLALQIAAGTSVYATYIAQYLAMISNVNDTFCIFGQDPAQKKYAAGPFVFSNGQWNAPCAGNNFSSNDRIRVTGSNVPSFNGSYKITVLAGGNIALNNGPPSTQPAPTVCTMQRYATFLGSGLGYQKNVIAYPIVLTLAQQATPFGLSVAKRNPSRPYNAVSFRRRSKKLH
jgi:hypothetical protein